MAQTGGGIAISGLPAGRAKFNATYAPTGHLVEGVPAFSAGPKKHLHRDPKTDRWLLANNLFDPADGGCVAYIPAAGGPVPTDERAWTVHTGGGWATSR